MADRDPRVEEGLHLLRRRRWFDAHEAFEAAWGEADGDERAALQGLIHVAVAFEHLRRGNAVRIVALRTQQLRSNRRSAGRPQKAPCCLQ